MATFLHGLYPLKIAIVTVGLSCAFVLRAFSQPVPDPMLPGVPGFTAAVTPALQPLKNVEPPRIRPPAIPEKQITVQPNLLTTKSIAVFPQFDGDGFFFVPSRTEATLGSANKVFQNAVIPFLSAIGFKNPATRFRPFDARYQGREMPTADLNILAKITCGQWWIKNDKKAQQSCTSLSEPSNLTLEANASFKTRIGMTVSQFKDTLERVEVEYFFTQQREVKPTENPGLLDIPKKVPLEHTGIRVEGRKGETGLFVTGRVINNDVNVTNVITIRPDDVLTAARKALTKIKGVSSVNDNLLMPVELLLLSYGGTGGDENQPALKYAYRTALLADFLGMKGTFYLWLDAGTGEILQLVPTMGSATANATGKTFDRDPNSLPATGLAHFDIDPPTGGQFTLKLTDVFSRLDWKGDGPDDSEVAHPSKEFDQASFSMNPTVQSVACKNGSTEFAQVDLMATISRYSATFNSAGSVVSPFPQKERRIVLDGEEGCTAYHSNPGFYFGLCGGYSDSTCPDIGDLNPAHDHTVVAHEFGHAFTLYQYGFPEDLDPLVQPKGKRGPDWCKGPTLEDEGVAPCPMPIRPDMFHDFADAWVQVLENTNCFGGWWGKNRGGGTDASLNCSKHNESGGMPRLSEVGMTFNPAQDHFPEHRKAGQLGDYSDMQIAAAALWATREGLKKREPAAGALLYLGRFVKTLAMTGWLGTPNLDKDTTGSAFYTDRDVYRYLVELEIKLASRWFGNPWESTVNKVVSGFARAGIFMISWGCLTTPAGNLCNSGADAVIDVDKDVVTRSDNPPTFHIWTGPVYKFDGTGTASNFSPTTATPAPCNTQYKIEISSDPTFPSATTTKANTGMVSNTSTAGCHGTWLPNATEWNDVKGALGETSVYYRVTTRNTSVVVPTCPASSASGDVRISTCPASGLFGSFEPPSVLVAPAVDTIPPSVPPNVSLTVASSSQINITWSASTDNVGVAGYKVVRNGTEIGVAMDLSFQDMGLSASTAYSYSVQAFDAAGNVSMQSNNVSATTSGGNGPPPSPPTNLLVQ